MRNPIPQFAGGSASSDNTRATRLSKLIVLATLVAIAGCGPKSQAAPSAAPQTAISGDAGYRAVVSRRDLRGGAIGSSAEVKATIVVVFASWCVHCRTELAMLRELAKHRPSLRVIGVNAYEEFDNISDEKKLAAFLLAEHPWLTVVRADGSLLRELGGVRKIPSLFVYDRNGEKVQDFRRAKRKPPSRDELAGLIDPLLG